VVIGERTTSLGTYELLQDFNFSLEAFPVLDLGTGDSLDCADLASLSVLGRNHFTVGALAESLHLGEDRLRHTGDELGICLPSSPFCKPFQWVVGS
jgi:hypothetical protein